MNSVRTSTASRGVCPSILSEGQGRETMLQDKSKLVIKGMNDLYDMNDFDSAWGDFVEAMTDKDRSIATHLGSEIILLRNMKRNRDTAQGCHCPNGPLLIYLYLWPLQQNLFYRCQSHSYLEVLQSFLSCMPFRYVLMLGILHDSKGFDVSWLTFLLFPYCRFHNVVNIASDAWYGLGKCRSGEILFKESTDRAAMMLSWWGEGLISLAVLHIKLGLV